MPRCLVALGLLTVLVGCGTPEKRQSAAPRGQGHWVTLPPETGSLVPRRVWVRDDGRMEGASSDAQSTSSRMVEDLQRRGSSTFRNSGN